MLAPAAAPPGRPRVFPQAEKTNQRIVGARGYSHGPENDSLFPCVAVNTKASRLEVDQDTLEPHGALHQPDRLATQQKQRNQEDASEDGVPAVRCDDGWPH